MANDLDALERTLRRRAHRHTSLESLKDGSNLQGCWRYGYEGCGEHHVCDRDCTIRFVCRNKEDVEAFELIDVVTELRSLRAQLSALPPSEVVEAIEAVRVAKHALTIPADSSAARYAQHNSIETACYRLADACLTWHRSPSPNVPPPEVVEALRRWGEATIAMRTDPHLGASIDLSDAEIHARNAVELWVRALRSSKAGGGEKKP